MKLGDRIRTPSSIDVGADAYKDWLHLNLFGPDGSMILINVSMHGDPHDRSSLAVAAVMAHDVQGWHHTVEIVRADQATVTPVEIAVGDVASVALEGGIVAVSSHTADVSVDVTATPLTAPLLVEEPVRFGSGWIAWRAAPRMAVVGDVIVRGHRWDTREVVAYHDHNWGRWHWGDDAGWEWATMIAPHATFVLAGTGGRDHRRLAHRLWCWIDGRRLVFNPRSVSVRRTGHFDDHLLRVPGAMAALHSERRDPGLPRQLAIAASDGFDSVELHLAIEDACQIIAADPVVSGAGFVHEMVGRFGYEAALAHRSVSGQGSMVTERVC